MTVFTSAAVLPRADYKGTEYFYFAKEKTGLLSTFGGKVDRNEKIYECAARELSEESLGVFCSQKTAKKMLKHHEKNKVIRLKNYSKQCIAYIMPVNLKLNPMKKFAKLRKNAKQASQKEVDEVVAIKVSKVIDKLKKNDVAFQSSLRPCVYNTLQLALKTKKI